nr:hypothetical protein [Tanacetum cinerariifolium]
MIVEQQVDKCVAEVHVDDVSIAGVAAECDVSATDDVVPTVVEEPSIPSPTPPTPPPQPSQNIPSTSQVQLTPAQSPQAQPQSPQHQPQPQPSQDGRMIADMDADKDVTLKDVVAKDVQYAEMEESADIQERQAESQAQIYHIDFEHANKVLSMQDDEVEPTELQEVVEGVVIRDPEDTANTATPSTIIHYEAKSKDKGKWILVEEPKPLKKQIEQDEAYARELEVELNKNIDWDEKFNSNVAFLQKTKEQLDEEDNR